MPELPRSYMRVARDISGYWGTYLPSLRLEPGTIGLIVDGVLKRESHLSHFADYHPADFVIDDQPRKEPTVVWTTRSVQMDVVEVQGSAPGQVASGGVRVRFGAANEAAIICNAPRERAYADLIKLKELMRHLRERQLWDDGYCVVTEVVDVNSAWICFSTDAGQQAEIRAKAPLALPGDPTAALAALSGSGELAASHSASKSSAFLSSLPDGGTPLFRAIRFNPRWLGLLEPRIGDARPPGRLGELADAIRNVRGGEEEFAEPEFGAP